VMQWLSVPVCQSEAESGHHPKQGSKEGSPPLSAGEGGGRGPSFYP